MASTDKPKSRRRRPRSPQGASPGTLTVHPSAIATSVNVLAIDSGIVTLHEDVSLAGTRRLAEEHELVWVDCVGLADVEFIAGIGELFGLHRLALEDVVNVGQRPKADFFEDHVFFVIKMLEDDSIASPDQLSLFFGPGFVITFQERPGDPFDPVRARIAEGRSRLVNGKPDYLAYALIDAVVDAYFPAVEKAGDEIDAVEDRILEGVSRRQSPDLHRLRRQMITFKRWLWPVRDAVAELMRADENLVSSDTKLYLNDTLDHSIRLIEIVETYRDTLGDLIDMHLALMQARTNDVINILTIVSTIFIPLTFLVGVWGMNFDPDSSPWNMPELRWYYGYPTALAAMLLIALALVGFFRWKKWL